jgi:predicted permease
LGFAVCAVLILSLGIGGTTAMFTVIYSVLLKPLAFRDSDRIVRLSLQATFIRYEEFRKAARSYDDIGAFQGSGLDNVTAFGGAEPEVLKRSSVTANFLQILGLEPLLGRGFTPEEDRPGGANVVLISSELWQRRFGSDSGILGKTLALDSGPHTIVGVLPPRFDFPFPGTDIWSPRAATITGTPTPSQLQSPVLTVFARLKPDVTMAQANAELTVLRAQYAAAHPGMLDAKPNSVDSAVPYKDRLVANVRSMLWMLFGAVGFVLLIACANIASLLLARANSRAREFAIRASLGAGRRRILRQLLVESVLLALIAGVVAVLLASWIVNAIRASTLFDLPRAGEIGLDPVMFCFATVLSLTTGLIFGLLPAFSASNIESAMLRAKGASSGSERRRFGVINLRRALVTVQVGLSVVLLIGAALLIQSIARMHTVNPGFNTSNILTMQITPSPTRYDINAKKTAFFDELLHRVQTLPGVRSTALTLTAPLTGWVGRPTQPADRQLLKLNERQITIEQNITPDFFQTLGIPLRRGREFTANDGPDTQPGVIIDERLARTFWPEYPNGEDPLGHPLLLGLNPHPATIIGIVGDVMMTFDGAPLPQMYRLYSQNPTFPFSTLMIKTDADPRHFAEMVRKQVLAIDPDQAVTAVRTMDELVEQSIGQRRAIMLLLEVFGGIAVLLAVTGIYGVLAYSAVQRTSEIGVRLALGAEGRDILRMLLAESLAISGAGIVLGLIGSYFLTRFLKTFLFRISPADPATFAAVALLFAIVALAASFFPVRRAARIDPAVALRCE